MRDKQQRQKRGSKEYFEGDLNDHEMSAQAQDEVDRIVWSTIPSTKPAKRPKEDDAKILALLKRTKLLPENAELAALQKMLDTDEPASKAGRAKLLTELQELPTSKPLQDSYQHLAYALTFNDEEAAASPSLFTYHAGSKAVAAH